jgi:hypothetical protein
MRFRIAVLLTSIAATAAAQDKPIRTPLQIATPISNFLGGVIRGHRQPPANASGTRFVIEHVNARCQFNFNTSDRAGEILLNTVDAKGNLHQYNLVVRHASTETPDPYNANLSYVSASVPHLSRRRNDGHQPGPDCFSLFEFRLKISGRLPGRGVGLHGRDAADPIELVPVRCPLDLRRRKHPTSFLPTRHPDL